MYSFHCFTYRQECAKVGRTDKLSVFPAFVPCACDNIAKLLLSLFAQIYNIKV